MYAPELTVPLLADFQGITLNQHRLREQTLSTIAIAKQIISWNMNIQERALKAIGLTCGRLSSSETFDRRTFTHNAATASMYGRMTLETRLILANFHNSSAVDNFTRCDSNSASSATSKPTLLRNLKQSATVLETLVTRTETPSTLRVTIPDCNAAAENLTVRSGGYSIRGAC